MGGRGKGKLPGPKSEKRKLPKPKGKRERGRRPHLKSNSTRQPDRAYARTNERNETISQLSTPQTPMFRGPGDFQISFFKCSSFSTVQFPNFQFPNCNWSTSLVSNFRMFKCPHLLNFQTSIIKIVKFKISYVKHGVVAISEFQNSQINKYKKIRYTNLPTFSEFHILRYEN